MMKKVVVGLIAGYLLTNISLQGFAQSALDQLKQMTGGGEHTGVKFDGSPKDQQRSGIDVFVKDEKSSENYSINKSSGSYDVNKSSGTNNNSQK